jgi:hypothetical protein
LVELAPVCAISETLPVGATLPEPGATLTVKVTA